MKVYEAIANAMRECGAQSLFGLMGDGNLRFINYWVHELEQPYYGTRHESAAIAMADGYARVSGKIAVATVTQGPGLTNALTALVAARKAHTPMLLVVGDVAASQEGWPQDIDHQAVFDAAGVPLIDIRNPDVAFSDAVQAVRLAISTRGPVGLSIATDTQEREWDAWHDDTTVNVEPARTPCTGDVRRAAEILLHAKRPVIIAGRGAVESDCGESLVAIGDRIGALFATSLRGKGLFEGHQYFVGLAGGLGTNLATSLIGEADVVLVVGASMNDFTTIRNTLVARSARVVRCDVDPAVALDGVEEECRLIGDAGDVTTALIAALDGVAVTSKGYRTPELTERLDSFRPEEEIVLVHAHDMFDPRELVMHVNQVLPKSRNVVTDSGRFFGDACSYMSVPDARSFVDGISFGSIGLGLGLAMGASVAQCDRSTIVFIGDGGCFMSLGEIETAVRYDLPLIIIVMNDSAYGSELQISRAWGLPDDLALFRPGDFSAVGLALGAQGARVRSIEELDDAIRQLDFERGPVILDCAVDPGVSARWLDDAFDRG